MKKLILLLLMLPFTAAALFSQTTGVKEIIIQSDPDSCEVHFDGVLVGKTPYAVSVTSGDHIVSIEKEGYYSQAKFIRADGEIKNNTISVKLEKAFPFKIDCDRDSLRVIVFRGNGASRQIFAQGVKTPATVQLPISKKPYQIELRRYNDKLAYKGNFSFNNERHNKTKILTWATSTHIVSANYNVFNTDESYLGGLKAEDVITKRYFKFGELNICSIPICPGLSTNAAKAMLYWQESNQPLVYPAHDDTPELREGDFGYRSVQMIPAFSAVLINGEFRIGGALLPFLDADLLTSYAWYPDLSGMLKFTHMSGHDIFVGPEFSSRFKVFNMNVRAGVQICYGKAHILRPIENSYVTVPYNRSLQFVVSTGFTLGGGRARGQNILRLF